MKIQKAGTWFPCALILLQDILYGFGDPLSKQAYNVMPVFSLLACRFTLAALVLFIPFGGKVLADIKKLKLQEWLVPSVCIAMTYIISNVSITLTAVTAVAFLRSLTILITPVLSCVLFKEKLGSKRIVLLLIAVLGLYLLCGYGGLSTFGLGEILALITSLLMAVSLLSGKNVLSKITPLTLTAVQSGVCAVLALLCALLFEGGVQVEGADFTAWFAIVYLAIMCTLSGYLLQNIALCSISASTVSLIQCLCPVMTGIFSYFMLGEKMTLIGMLGSALILLSLCLSTLLNRHENKIS